jgi:hypothetical protein
LLAGRSLTIYVGAPDGLRRKGRSSGSSPQVSAAANAAAVIDIEVSGEALASEGPARREASMERPHDIRVTNGVFGIRLRVGVAVAAAAFLALGYGDGFSPSS